MRFKLEIYVRNIGCPMSAFCIQSTGGDVVLIVQELRNMFYL